MIVRCKKPEDNTNIFYICGNCDDLGNKLAPIEMENALKKAHFDYVAQQYWEKKFLLSVHRKKSLNYWIYEYDPKKDCFFSYDKKRKVDVNFQNLFAGKSSNLWDDDLKPCDRKKTFAFRSPNLNKPTVVDYKKNKLTKIERKYNSLIIYDRLDDIKPVFFKINENITLG